jgi:hypothetical protein
MWVEYWEIFLRAIGVFTAGKDFWYSSSVDQADILFISVGAGAIAPQTLPVFRGSQGAGSPNGSTNADEEIVAVTLRVLQRWNIIFYTVSRS